MAQTVIMPKLGQTVEESTILKWHKHEGETVKKGDILFEIETDKAVLEIESFFDGTLLKIIVPENVAVPVSVPVAFIGAPGEAIPEITTPPPAARSTPPKASAPAPAVAIPIQATNTNILPTGAIATPANAMPRRQTVSPRARRLIKDCAISAAKITGSGPNGRIIEKNVLDYLATKNFAQLKITPAAKALARANAIDILDLPPSGNGGRLTVEDVKQAIAEKPQQMTKMRQVIAQRLAHSFSTTPHFFVTVSTDMTDLINLRKTFRKDQIAYSVTDFIIKASAMALARFPAVNSFTTDGKTVRLNTRVHIGLAVEVPAGLVVPVIRNAHSITFPELHEQVAQLARQARDGQLTPDQMAGGTFTISNMGMLDVENFTAIINPGESAILAVSSTRPTPVVQQGQIVIRNMMKMTLSSDHRIIDGATAARFINQIKLFIEDTDLWKNMILS